ncbi:MAG: AarF/UbiB family protein [Solirubrobacteraceae bacterium]
MCRIERVLRDAWGRRPTDELDDLDREPVAVTPISQVHRGVLDGAAVAVKVLRPGLAAAVRQDLGLLEGLRRPLQAAFPALDAGAALREFRERVLEELDLENEASVQQAANAGNSARKRSARWPSRRSRFAMSASSTPSTARPSRSNFGVVAMPFDDRPVSNGRIGPACSHHYAWLGHALVDALSATLAVTQETPRDRPSLQLVAHRKPSAPARASHRPTLHEHRLRWLGGLSPATSTSPVKIWPTRVFVLAQTGPGRGQARDCVCPTAAAGPGCSTALLVTASRATQSRAFANAARLRRRCCICSC